MAEGAIRLAIDRSSIIWGEAHSPPSVSSVLAGHSAERCFSSRRYRSKVTAMETRRATALAVRRSSRDSRGSASTSQDSSRYSPHLM